MSGYYDRGASAGGHDHGYFNREDVTGSSGVGVGATGGPGPIANENLEVDPQNPNIVRATTPTGEPAPDETAGTNSPARVGGSYPDIVEGSDSERTGTSWGLSGVEDADTLSTPMGDRPEGEGQNEASPNRNTGDRLSRDELSDVGSWSTIDDHSSAGSPTGNS
ncbi:MAG: hypothetical protein ACJ78Q_09175 [Chloroflexia bacterium]